jgi:hypothetical protein
MVHMPSEPSPVDAGAPPDGEVVEFGGDAPASRRHWDFAGVGRSLSTDRRLVPLAAGLGAVAVLASLVSEWQVSTIDAEVFGGGPEAKPVPTGVIDLGALGAGYLIGLFPLVAAVVLTMFGPASARRWVRLVGLSVGGTLLGLLFATVSSLGDESRPMPKVYALQFDENQVQFTYGRGLWCAVVGVLLAMLALYLAGRLLPSGPAPTAGPAVPAEDPAWAWRRPPAPREETTPDQPLELTVGPAKPFQSLGDDRDEPTRS